MSNLILLFVCLIIGIILKKSKIIPENFHTSLNAFVINISLSAFSLYYISKIELNSSVIYPVLVVWIGIFAAILFFAGLGKIFGWKSSLIGALIMCAGFGNTSFVGIPLIQAMYGEEGLKTVMLVDQPGFVALSTVGILVANFYSGSKDSMLKHLSKILKFPPFIAFVIALLLNIFSIEIPKDFDEVLMKLGATTVPLALVSVGSQMQWKKIEKKEGFHLFIGLLFKLVLLPLLILVIYKYIFHQSGDVIDICILEAAMAPMITAAIIASAHDLEPKFCNLMVAVGIPVSLITVGIWHIILPFL
ncbi:AEC family transporter [Cloacibacterium sp. TD35]|uniref:AEC family transporter n=1 Tax=Cloacibacterium sp. TD35 TaxID=2976818 RepID=UPI00237D5E9D|nr:AEC family transporter [Cloacibacterium sp. TD35]WDT68084.1 AEC family transporter [Cloacibacterium sp. TD35]